ncbi:hypothetical protein O181_110891 [Austropuccinia psidii MF-1]|uniref:HAT C-terminal dimerisation domain-containing protein n=1 Tax=Austropuccinia psidii MF-1 TaxID=1389203 RepID=A0A9Q3PS81_9BASI|nr:hypothetical protein [Austropuccinia psidii MF-1]
MVAKLSKYLQLLLVKTPEICVAVLDPCFKRYNSKLQKFGTSADQFSRIFEEQARKHYIGSSPMVNVAEKDSGFFNEMYQSTPFEASSFEHELNQYLSEPIKQKAATIVSFWRSWATMFPTLEVMACKYLDIPATSSPSERFLLINAHLFW